MPDDQNAIAMKAVLEQVAALTAAVTTLTDTTTAQAKLIQGVRDHNLRLLDDVKDAKRRLKAAAPNSALEDKLEAEDRDRRRDALNLVTQPDGTVRLASGPSDRGSSVALTREQARDPVQYKAAKEAAAKAGVPLVIANGSQDPTMRNSGRREVVQSKVFTFDDTHDRVRYVRADMETGDNLVNRRLTAEREGYKVKTFYGPEDLPAHARQKFNLMEAAANAQSDT